MDVGFLGWNNGSIPPLPWDWSWATWPLTFSGRNKTTSDWFSSSFILSCWSSPGPGLPFTILEATPACRAHHLITVVPYRFSDPSWGTATPHFFVVVISTNWGSQCRIGRRGTFKSTQTRPPLGGDLIKSTQTHLSSLPSSHSEDQKPPTVTCPLSSEWDGTATKRWNWDMGGAQMKGWAPPLINKKNGYSSFFLQVLFLAHLKLFAGRNNCFERWSQHEI